MSIVKQCFLTVTVTFLIVYAVISWLVTRSFWQMLIVSKTTYKYVIVCVVLSWQNDILNLKPGYLLQVRHCLCSVFMTERYIELKTRLLRITIIVVMELKTRVAHLFYFADVKLICHCDHMRADHLLWPTRNNPY